MYNLQNCYNHLFITEQFVLFCFSTLLNFPCNPACIFEQSLFVFFLLIFILFISFSCLTAWTRTYSIMLKSWSKKGHSYLLSILVKKLLVYNISSNFFVDILYLVEEVPFNSQFIGSFYLELVLNFIHFSVSCNFSFFKFLICWIILIFNCLTRHIWDKSHFSMVYSSFYTLLDLVSFFFFFLRFFHLWSWEILVCIFLF